MLHEMDAREAHGDAAADLEKALRPMHEQMQRAVREMQERTEHVSEGSGGR